ncbi:hypothetical protein Ais01nite_32800 [Asanoa ishikariensis]|uniref:Exo-alpha-sialidase n=1 Tax=Asanoa ishikariensis TaxID=137265 RepID=A0A1H3UY48_9ACTN|nr:hypothetical protein [Asanoa ishikariensis]GIF65245.1 hypothetical protein Ais01nite_32800 [Asanoa ishikariensis]SDZ66739.1 hypothetical protein SAMN05421684_8283 [Asanoa ishikariensis]
MRGRIMMAAAVVLVLLAGCSIGDIRRKPPPPPTSAPAPTPEAEFEVRHASIPVPPSYQLQNVEFVDQALGYALFGRCGSTTGAPGPGENCSAAVVRTEDGGRSWHQVYHPRPEGKSHQLYADRARLVLYVEPDGYYVSFDRGATYEYAAGDDNVLRPIFGEYQACCDGDEKQRVVWFDGHGRPTPTRTQPNVPNLLAVASAAHWLFAVGIDDSGRPISTVSNDQGTTWRQVPVAGASGKLGSVRITVDRSGTYAWLIGQTDLISWPAIWFFDGQGWRPMSAAGHPERYTSAVALEDASLAVTTPQRPGRVFGGAFEKVDWPIGDCFLRVLPEGTLFCSAGVVNWLGIEDFGERKWVRVMVGNE